MLIIPAIDIRGGKCVRLFQGDYGKETVYGDDPVEMAQRWVRQGAKFLHLVDLDGAREGIPHNKATIRAIAERSPVPLQVGGGIRDMVTLHDYLSLGIRRVILGTAAIAHPHFLEQACTKWPGRVAVDIAAKGGMAAISGWVREAEVRAVDWAKRCEELGASVIIFTDVLRDGTQKGVNLEATLEMARAIQIPLIASGGVSTIADIEALLPLEKEGVSGVIVGRALYAGTVKLPEAIALAEGKGNSGAG
jgi:phosphoribosylformimino-5-aminoimidazole carboxamide ribotide isomerase